jgi:multidrug resistance efflux pump
MFDSRRIVIVVAALATLTWFWITSGHITTDNAYVDADLGTE